MAANTTYEGFTQSTFFWSVTLSNCVGAIFKGTVAVVLFSNNCKPKSPLKSAFFFILAFGYMVDFMNTLSWAFGNIIDYPNDNVLTTISVIIQWYSRFFEGFWNLILAGNQCSALAFPAVYNKLWSGKPYTFFVHLVLLFPILCNGYTFITDLKCHINFYSVNCYSFQVQNMIEAAIVTISMSLFALLIGLCGFIWTRTSKKLSKAYKLLIIQTLSTSIFQSLNSIFFAYSALGDRNNVYFWEAISAIFSFLQHYPSVVVLFFVSNHVRHGYYKFYRLKCLIPEGNITMVSPASLKPPSPKFYNDGITKVF